MKHKIFKIFLIIIFATTSFGYFAQAQRFPLTENEQSDTLGNTRNAVNPGTSQTDPADDKVNDPPDDKVNDPADDKVNDPSKINQKTGLQITLTNPLKADNLEDFIGLVLAVILRFLIPILAILFIYTGFQLVMARGNEKALGTAKNNFFNLVIGAVLILGAWTFGNVILNTLKEVGILN